MKKIISLALSLALILSAVPAFAESGQSSQLEKAIQTVKSVVSIPQEYKVFDYSSYQSEREDGKSVTVWNLQWSKEDGSATIDAGVDSLGNLIQFYRYTDSDESGLAKVSREEGKKAAEAFLAKAMPSLAKDMRIVNEKSAAAAAAYGLHYTYQLYRNGIAAPFIQASLRVDKYTGQVSQFSGLEGGQTIPDFPSAEPKVSAGDAAKLYIEKLGPELSYYPYFDYQKKTLTVFAGYAMNNSGGKAIDAATGQVRDICADGMLRYGSTAEAKDEGMGSGANGGAMTPEEQKALNNVSGLIGKEKAESVLRREAGMKSDLKVNSAYLSRDTVDEDRYYWRFSFDGASGSVDAKTGELLNFSIYQDRTADEKTKVTQEQAKRTAQSFAERVAADKLKECELKEEKQGQDDVYKSSVYIDPTSYGFYFQRQVNGVGVADNGLNITVNAQTGDIVYYSNSWYEKAVFPSVEQAMDAAAAFGKFNEDGRLRLAYAMTDADTVSLVYDFENSVLPYLINPFDGGQMDRRGRAFRDGSAPEYGDIAGHWAEKTIQALSDNGYYLEGESFGPDRTITQEDFLRYLYSRSWMGADQDEFYSMLIRNKIVLEGEKAPDRALTRQEAAKYMVRFLGFDKLALKSAIFRDLFTDKVEEGYKGYAGICYGMGVMKGDEKGRFNGTAVMTRAEAASALYQLLQAEQPRI